MLLDFNFYQRRYSIDYGDFPGGTYHDTEYHGFSIDIDEDDYVDINTLDGYGDYADMDGITSLEELLQYLNDHEGEIEDNREIFDELKEFIADSIRKEVDNEQRLERAC